MDDFKVYSYPFFASDLRFNRDIAFLTIPCVTHDSIFTIDLMRRSWIQWHSRFYISLSIHWRFQVLQGLCFHWRFIDQQWHSIFYNSMRQIWLYFSINLMRRSWIHWRCRFQTSAVTQYSLKISRSTVTVFAADLWISRDIAFLTIPCISHGSIFAIDLMRRSWIHWLCRLHTSVVTQYSLTISRSIVTLFSPTIYGSAMT
jgi:hypothetical protein